MKSLDKNKQFSEPSNLKRVELRKNLMAGATALFYWEIACYYTGFVSFLSAKKLNSYCIIIIMSSSGLQ